MWYYTLMLNFVPIFYADFLLKNMWWIVALCAIALISLLLWLDRRLLFKEKKKEVSEEQASLYLDALGGESNVLERALEGSRIVLRLKDYGAVNRDKLREAGVTGFIQMADRLTLVIKDNAMAVYDKIFPNA